MLKSNRENNIITSPITRKKFSADLKHGKLLLVCFETILNAAVYISNLPDFCFKPKQVNISDLLLLGKDGCYGSFATRYRKFLTFQLLASLLAAVASWFPSRKRSLVPTTSLLWSNDSAVHDEKLFEDSEQVFWRYY